MQVSIWPPCCGKAGSTRGNRAIPFSAAVAGRMLLGVASYSVADLAVLDTLNEAASSKEAIWPRLDVFNVLDCRSIQDFEKYVPGIGKVFQTPVVGYWEEGLLKEKKRGAKRDAICWRESTRPFSLSLPWISEGQAVTILKRWSHAEPDVFSSSRYGSMPEFPLRQLIAQYPPRRWPWICGAMVLVFSWCCWGSSGWCSAAASRAAAAA